MGASRHSIKAGRKTSLEKLQGYRGELSLEGRGWSLAECVRNQHIQTSPWTKLLLNQDQVLVSGESVLVCCQDKDRQLAALRDDQRLQAQQAESALGNLKKQLEISAHNTFSDMKKKMEEVEADLSSSKSLREKQCKEFNQQLEELQRTYEEQIAELKLQQEQERTQFLQTLVGEKEKLVQEHRREIQALEQQAWVDRNHNAQTVSDLEAQVGSLRKDLAAAHSQKKLQLKEHERLRDQERHQAVLDQEMALQSLRKEMEQLRQDLEKTHRAERELAQQKVSLNGPPAIGRAFSDADNVLEGKAFVSIAYREGRVHYGDPSPTGQKTLYSANCPLINPSVFHGRLSESKGQGYQHFPADSSFLSNPEFHGFYSVSACVCEPNLHPPLRALGALFLQIKLVSLSSEAQICFALCSSLAFEKHCNNHDFLSQFLCPFHLFPATRYPHYGVRHCVIFGKALGEYRLVGEVKLCCLMFRPQQRASFTARSAADSKTTKPLLFKCRSSRPTWWGLKTSVVGSDDASVAPVDGKIEACVYCHLLAEAKASCRPSQQRYGPWGSKPERCHKSMSIYRSQCAKLLEKEHSQKMAKSAQVTAQLQMSLEDTRNAQKTLEQLLEEAQNHWLEEKKRILLQHHQENKVRSHAAVCFLPFTKAAVSVVLYISLGFPVNQTRGLFALPHIRAGTSPEWLLRLRMKMCSSEFSEK
ncbi:hypothetical protein DNTS_032237 [Danionella cerebrum]|uniref:Uncharacterized protein n=1 Tax=Danionella cerebrum TaxID=2873325 RepID=A0A553Q6G0_9TELE|nr:hypothetical protein DNTS_032237 [Danionella translucida]